MIASPGELHRAFEDAFNRHDVESIAALYEPAGVLVRATAPARGIDAIREHYRGILATRPSIELRTLGVNVSGDLAMLHGRWTLHAGSTDGRPIRREGRNTEVARRQDDGRWLFVIDNPLVPQD